MTPRPLLIAASLAAGLAASAAATAAPATAARSATPTVTAPSSVTEGDVFTVSVKVPRGAERVLLQHQETDSVGDRHWDTVKRSRAHGRRLTYRATAGEGDTEAFRARALFADHAPTMSKASRTTVWHWTPLTSFDAYEGTPGSSRYLTFAIAGVVHNGWAAYANYPSYETGWTLGRHCTALRADVGVTDKSATGSSALLQLTTDDTTTVFASGALTPGMVQSVDVPLASPYRLQVHAQDTSPDGVQAYPALGDPEVLCTGLG